MLLTHPFKPFFNADSKILILGSFPSVKSRELGFYYQNKNNRFWRIFEKNFNEKLIFDDKNLQIKRQKDFLKRYKIALWDVFQMCFIKGSSDLSIKGAKFNDIEKLLAKSRITHIFITGKTAYNAFIKAFDELKSSTTYLPSSSSANANFSLEKLCEIYTQIKISLEA